MLNKSNKLVSFRSSILDMKNNNSYLPEAYANPKKETGKKLKKYI